MNVPTGWTERRDTIEVSAEAMREVVTTFQRLGMFRGSLVSLAAMCEIEPGMRQYGETVETVIGEVDELWLAMGKILAADMTEGELRRFRATEKLAV